MMLRAVGRRCSTGSATVLGDLAQATTPWASRSWEDALTHLGKPAAHVEQLTLGFRVPGEVIEYAARLLPVVAPGLEPPRSVRRARGELDVRRVEALDGAVVPAVAAARDRVGSVGVIVPDVLVDRVGALLEAAGVAHARLGDEPAGLDEGAVEFDVPLDLVPASLAKGLEFDHVVLLEPEASGGRRGRPDDRAATPLRLPHPGRHQPGRAARRRPARGARRSLSNHARPRASRVVTGSHRSGVSRDPSTRPAARARARRRGSGRRHRGHRPEPRRTAVRTRSRSRSTGPGRRSAVTA